MSTQAGVYRGRAVAGSEQYGQTSNGHDQIVLELDLLDIGERVSTFLIFTEKSAPYAMKRLRACGWTGTDLTDLAGIDASEVNVEVRYEEYKGEQKMKVEIVANSGVKLANPLDDAKKKAFGAKYKSLASTTAPKGNGAVGGVKF